MSVGFNIIGNSKAHKDFKSKFSSISNFNEFIWYLEDIFIINNVFIAQIPVQEGFTINLVFFNKTNFCDTNSSCSYCYPITSNLFTLFKNFIFI
jgi:hypothetical protein